MAVRTLTQTMNPYVGSSPANIPSDLEMPLFAAWAEKYEVKETPITKLIPQAKKKYDQVKIRVGQRYNPHFETAIKATTANNSQNIDIDTTTNLRVGDILEIVDYYTGTSFLDYSTREIVRVESITDSDTIVATRDMDETSSGSWPVHPVDAYVRKISRASNLTDAFAQAPVHRGDFLYTYATYIESSVATTLQAKHVGSFEAREGYWQDDIANLTEDVKWWREQAFVSGRRMVGDTTSTPTKPHTGGGILWWLENNIVSTNIVDVADANLNIFHVDDILRSVYNTNRRGPATHVLMSPNTAAIWNLLIHPLREAGMGDTSVTLRTTRIETEWADIKLVKTRNIPDGVMAFIDPSDWEWGAAEGVDWTVVKRGPQETGKATEEWAVFGQWAIICKDLTRQCLIHGFNTDLTTYPGRNFLV